MIHARKLILSLAILTVAVGGFCLSRADAARQDTVSCVIDVLVDTKDQAGVVVGTETYHKVFTLADGGTFSDDFSTRTRLKVFEASFQKANGDKTVSIDWFADVSVFNSVDLRTSVTLEGGDKRGKSVGQNTLFSSNGSTTTSYTLTVAN